MGYAVVHLEKAKGSDSGMSAHIERKIHPANADETRTSLNRELIQFPEGVLDRTHAIAHRLSTAGLKRKIGNNQVKAIRVLLTGSHDDMMRIEREGKLGEWARDNVDWLKATFGAENVVSAVLHMDEKTPHIHATIIPIVYGERRKAAAERKKGQENPDKSKKKYRKKASTEPRLCADDVMARARLKSYQNSYPAAMAKYGLQRGVDGSLAKHMSTSEYYKDLMGQQESIQGNIDFLLAQQEELNQKLKDTKSDVHKQRRENAVNDATAAIANTVGSLFGGGKLKDVEMENRKLKQQLAADKKLMHDMENAHTNEVDALNHKHEQEKSALQDQINEVNSLFPNVPLLLPVAHKCRDIGLSESQTRSVVNFHPIQFTGKLYYRQERKYIDAEDVTISVGRGKTDKPSFNLLINGVRFLDWIKEQLRKLREMLEKTQTIRKISRGLHLR